MIGELSIPGSSFLHRMDARARLLALPALVAIFLVPSEPLMTLCCAVGLAGMVAAAVGWRELGRALRAIAPALLLIGLLTPPFTREGRALVVVLGVPLVTTGGAAWAITFIARLAGVSIGLYGLLRTMEAEALVPALRWFGLPYRAALVVTITFRYIPFLAKTWENVRDAHRLRTAGSAVRRRGLASSWLPMLSSILIQAVRGVPALAMALEGRGVGRGGPRTSLAALGPVRRFVAHTAVVAGIAAAVLAALALPQTRSIFALPGL